MCIKLRIMRMNISLNDHLAERVRTEAEARGISMSAFIAETLETTLNPQEASEPPPFRLVTVQGVHVQPGVDIDRIRSLDDLDEEAG